MPRRPSGPVEEASPLRRARLARNLTLEDVVEEIDLRTLGGHSGVTPSMVSGWELGRHTTSIGHRKTLCETSHEAFDSGVVFGPAAAARLVDHGRQAYAAARRIETLAQIGDLRVVIDGRAPA